MTKEKINSPFDNFMAIICIISLLAFPLIIIEQVLFNYLPTAIMMVVDLTLFLIGTAYFRFILGKETLKLKINIKK